MHRLQLQQPTQAFGNESSRTLTTEGYFIAYSVLN